MSQTKTITLRTENDSVDLDKVVADLVSSNPDVVVNSWKKKGKHTKSSKKTDAVVV